MENRTAITAAARQTGIEKRSSKHSALVIAEVAKAATLMNREISAGELNEWDRTLSRYGLEEIQVAFREYRKTNTYWPTPEQIEKIVKTSRDHQAMFWGGNGPAKCLTCADTGYKPSTLDRKGNYRVQRCDCRRTA